MWGGSCALALAIAWACCACSFRPGLVAPADSSTDSPSVDASRVVDAAIDTPPLSPIVLVQATSGIGTPWGGAGNSVASAPITTTAGNLLAAYIVYSAATSIQAITDDAGDTWTVLDTVVDGTNHQKASIAYASNVVGGLVSVSVRFHQTECCRMIIVHEISGASTSDPVDVFGHEHQKDPSTASDSVASGTVVTTAPGDYVFAGTADSANVSGQTIAAGTEATLRAGYSNASTGGDSAATEDWTAPGVGPITSTFTFSQSNGATLTMQMALKH